MALKISSDIFELISSQMIFMINLLRFLLRQLNKQYRYKMFEDDVLSSQQEELDFLLDYSRISEGRKETSFNEFSISRDKLNISEKQRTRQESYEDIMKQIHQTKLEKIDLTTQLEKLKKEIYNSYLQTFQQELEQLNQQNQQLRRDIDKSQKKNDDNRSERYSNRSSIKMKTSVKSNYGNQNKKTNTKAQRNRVSPNMLFAKKEIKLAQSTTNLGRSHIQSPKRHRKRESQLTERKMDQNHSMGVSVNISVLDQKMDEFNFKQSVSKQCLKMQKQPDKNIFIQILEDILVEQKDYQSKNYGPLENYPQITPENNVTNEIAFINDLEDEVKTANEKIEILSLIVSKFQKDIKELNVNVRNAEEWTKKLWEVKGKYIDMQRKCNELAPLKKEVGQKQQKLSKLKQRFVSNIQEEKAITSIETMIKLLSNPSKTFNQSTKLYMTYYRQIKELFKYDQQDQNKRYIKVIKVKQTIDSIRQGRRKFNELIHIYESRIIKIEEKLSKIKLNNQKK